MRHLLINQYFDHDELLNIQKLTSNHADVHQENPEMVISVMFQREEADVTVKNTKKYRKINQ